MTSVSDAPAAAAQSSSTADQPQSVRSSRRLTNRLLGFGTLPLIATLASLLLVPLVTRAAGPTGWASIATGQAIGAVSATLVQFGWFVTGPPRIARMGLREARDLYYTSALMRLLLLLLSTPVLVFLTVILVRPEWSLPALALGIGVSLSGLSSSWFYIGRGTPRGLLLLEVLPRFAGTALSCAILLSGGSVLTYSLVFVSVEVVIAAAVLRVNARRTRSRSTHLRDVRVALREQAGLVISSLLALGYQRAAVPIVATMSLPAVALYAVGDRTQGYARLPLGPVVQTLQGWVYESIDTEHFRMRALRATGAVLGISLLVAVGVWLALPPFSAVFFGEALRLGPDAALPICVALIAVGLSLGLTTFVLVPAGRMAVISWSGIAASIMCVPLLLIGTSSAGAIGALWAVTAAEATVAAVESVFAWRALERTPQR